MLSTEEKIEKITFLKEIIENDNKNIKDLKTFFELSEGKCDFKLDLSCLNKDYKVNNKKVTNPEEFMKEFIKFNEAVLSFNCIINFELWGKIIQIVHNELDAQMQTAKKELETLIK